jgi:hypothetical protein
LVEFIRDFRRPGSVSDKRIAGLPRTSTYDENSMVVLVKIADKFTTIGEEVCI